jgi:DNA polymerase III sliding clamp (beta) subunit (PCNA family)
MHCASKDETRYVLNGVRIQGNLAVATDGRTLFAAVGYREDDDDARDALIPTRAAKAAWPQSKGKRGTLLPMLTINPKEDGKEATVTVTDREFDRATIKEIDGNYPQFGAVMTEASKHTLRVGINVKLLLNIAKCHGEDEMFLHLNPEEREGDQLKGAIIVTSKNTEAMAILMPLRESYDLQGNQAVKEMTKLRAEYLEKIKAKAAVEAAATDNPQPSDQ